MSGSSSPQVTLDQVKHVAGLAHIPVTNEEAKKLASAFAETLQVIENLKSVDVSQVEPTHQVTGLENVTRPDVVDHDRMLTQDQALANASQTHQGYFVVPRVLSTDV
jgi:aspartyl-tRNA(Asn)/glutamyl-tRNA(Gln) amidotransferase subunit C